MNRRSFLAALAAPLIAKPTLEEVARLGWRRRFFPGWSPAAVSSRELTLSIEEFSRRVLAPAIAQIANDIDRLALERARDYAFYCGADWGRVA